MKKPIFRRLSHKMMSMLMRKIDAARLEEQRYYCATVHDTCKMHPSALIYNQHGDCNSITIGANTHICGQLNVFPVFGQIHIGDWCYIGENSRIWSQDLVKIGNHVLISHLVDIHDTNSHPIEWEKRRLDINVIFSGNGDRQISDTESSPVIIEDDVWIGCKSIILKGVTIGRGAIVGAGSVVTKNIPAWTVVAGNPARIVRSSMEPSI